jgi:hypothetical protein
MFVKHQKNLLAFALLVSAWCAQADQGALEPPLSDASKAAARKTLEAALQDKDISKQQYDTAISWLAATPCDGVSRSLNSARKRELGLAIAKQKKLKKVDVYQSFSDTGWSIIYVGTRVSDNGYLFYSGNPLAAAHPITVWGGAAMIFETSEIAQWVLTNVPGIPTRLANCFAWHVTLNRDL